MRRFLLVFLLAGASAFGQHTVDIQEDEEFYSTFSIIAFDPATGELGVGVQSRAFRAGAAVPWAEAGVGAVATQAAANQFYGPLAMELFLEGESPESVIETLTEEDIGRDRRQVAVINAMGRSAAFTGEDILGQANYAGHLAGSTYSVQGNTLAGPQVLEEMARAYEEASGEMAERLLAALEAGQAAGGDVRGMQSGAILVVRPLEGNQTTDRWVDIRVDDADDPFVELRRLLDISLSGRQADRAADLRQAGQLAEAIEAQAKAAAMNPRRDNYLYTLAEWYAEARDQRNALNTLRAAIEKNERWKATARGSEAFAEYADVGEFLRLVQN